MALTSIERAIGHVFDNRSLLDRALTHRSHGASHNERLEFLGDSVLNCVIAQALYEQFSDVREGDLSRLRANLVRQETLAQIAQQFGLGDHLRLGEGELKSGGFRRPSILADALEALFGAVFVDGGFERARQTILRLYEPFLASLDPLRSGKDAKTSLQEYLQGRRLALPQYLLRATRGEAHAQEFEVECLIPELGIAATGRGHSRRAAEQEAARRAFELTSAK
ncbi:MAG: Ribonuclease 3 [Rhodocyclaceae bacterium]|nr:MAG: ribonuclease III [Rhodocyclaceae bacterium]MBE7422082.1 ribonuclease III [Zoogloeaceae bacterium]MBV6408235.1 Ribonuclease 3 [Rhodocyclaceae bacterium]MCK6383575.1 ribonuclease III [Rhodocyclaceae bacterium]CAG0926995.1 Ribonuclease 3 [Rhodocyclaceae bacterium]